MRTIAKRLCKRSFQRIDGTGVLLRAFKIPKKSIGGERDLQKEIISLTVRNENIIRGQQVLLMDDITTTGTSLKAGKYVLEQSGAKIVALLALGETIKTQTNGGSNYGPNTYIDIGRNLKGWTKNH